MNTHRNHAAIVLGLFSWLLIVLSGNFTPQSKNTPAKYSPTAAVFAGNGEGAFYRIQSTYTTCDTSIDDTKKGLEKPNQSKVFYMDSTWWMMAIRKSTNKWNLWRYDSVRTWTPVHEFSTSQKNRPDVIPDYATSSLYVFFSAKSGTSSLTKLSYDAGTGTWSETSSSTIADIRSVGDNPASFVRAKNGNLWIFMAADTHLVAVTSSDDGATWSSPIVLIDSLNVPTGLTDAVAFTDSGSIDFIGVGVAENSDPSSRFYFLSHKDTDGNSTWTDESAELLQLGSENADDHLHLAVDGDNNIYMITKTRGGGITLPENTLYKRGKGVTVSDTNIVNTKKGLEKPNQTKIFYHDGTWWMMGIKRSTNKWNLWRHDGLLDWSTNYEFSVSSKMNPDVYIDNASNTLYVFFSGNSSSSLWTMSYTVLTRTWSKLSESAVPEVTTRGDNPASFTVAKNGDFWAFMAADTQLIGVHSTDQGATWSSAITILDTLFSAGGLTDAIGFTDDNGVDYLGLALAENSATSSKFGFFIHNDDSAETSWVDESANVGPLGSERADDHVALAVDTSGNVYMVTKTTGGGIGSPENVLYKRHADSTWSSFTLIDGTDWTRPAVVIDAQNDTLYVFGTRESASLGKIVEYKKCKIGEESTLETATRTTAIDNGTEVMFNVCVPGHAVYDSTALMIAADNDDTGEIWFARVRIGTSDGPFVIGRWRKFVIINEATDWTRPVVVVDMDHDSLYVMGTRETPALGKVVEYKRCLIGEESTLSDDFLRTEVIADGADAFPNISVPPHAVYDSTEFMFIVDNEDENNVWFRRLPIGTAPACPTYIDSSIKSISIAKMGNDVKLDWTFVAEADSYVVYRSTRPMFLAADSSRLAAVLTNTYTDTGALGDPDVNHFYMVRAYIGGSPGPLSGRVGEFEYLLLAPAGKKNNFIALSLNDTALTMASDIAARIGPSCDLISRWVESSQAWSSYIPGLPVLDFAVDVNEVYMVSVTTQDTLCLVGAVPEGHQYSLITTGGKNNNGIMVLMDTDSLTMASELSSAIGPVDLVSRWVAASQAYSSYIPGIPVLDFPIVAGQPLMVSVTQDTTWPAR